jgi:hypothetical protein
MRCQSVIKHLASYHQGLLADRMHSQIQVHLNDCRNCQKERDKFVEMTTFLQNVPQMPAPDQLAANIQKKMGKSNAGAGSNWRWPAAYATAVGICGCFLLLTMQPFRSLQRIQPVVMIAEDRQMARESVAEQEPQVTHTVFLALRPKPVLMASRAASPEPAAPPLQTDVFSELQSGRAKSMRAPRAQADAESSNTAVNSRAQEAENSATFHDFQSDLQTIIHTVGGSIQSIDSHALAVTMPAAAYVDFLAKIQGVATIAATSSASPEPAARQWILEIHLN